MIEFQLIDDTENIEVGLTDNTENIEVELIKEINSYNELKDKPKINNITLQGNKTLHELGIQPEGDYAINSEVNAKLAQKVDKVSGKGLSTNDYTTPEKEKLASLENYDDTEIRELIDGKQPRGDYITQETDPTVPNHVKSISQNDITNWNNKADESDIPDVSDFITKNVNDLVYYTLKTNTGSLIDLEINQTTYVVTLSLKDQDGNIISTDTIDLPLENVVVNGSYDSTNQKIVLTLQNGNTVDIPVGALIAGLQSEITSSNKLASDLVDDSNSGNKFTTTSEKQTWNGKYSKPSGGIPKSDLESSVQTSLEKADTAIQSLSPAVLKDGGSATQTVSLSSGTGTTALGVKSRATSSYISFSNSSAWIGSIGVTSDKKPTFYNGSSYTLAYTSDIPTKTSDLTNDSGYITSYTETDPTVPSHVKNITQANITSWNNKSDFSGNYNDLSNKPTIPDELSDLSDDSTHRLVTDTEKTTWNGKANVSDIPKIFYGTSATGASTAAKVVVCGDFTETDLVAGTRITVLFTNANSYNGQATLNINGTGAKNIYYNGSTTNARYMWVAGESVDFIYNGTQWATINGGLATTSYYGVTKLYTSAASDSQAYALTPRSLYYFANYSIAPYYSASKTYAVGDKVRYSYYIYECTTEIDTPESWNAEHWQQIDTIQEQIDILKDSIPSEVTETTVSNWGFTKNAGTITEITMNGSSKGTSGVIDLGTVITSHQDISGKLDANKVKNTMSTTAGDVYDVRYINTMLGDIETLLSEV